MSLESSMTQKSSQVFGSLEITTGTGSSANTEPRTLFGKNTCHCEDIGCVTVPAACNEEVIISESPPRQVDSTTTSSTSYYFEVKNFRNSAISFSDNKASSLGTVESVRQSTNSLQEITSQSESVKKRRHHHHCLTYKGSQSVNSPSVSSEVEKSNDGCCASDSKCCCVRCLELLSKLKKETDSSDFQTKPRKMKSSIKRNTDLNPSGHLMGSTQVPTHNNKPRLPAINPDILEAVNKNKPPLLTITTAALNAVRMHSPLALPLSELITMSQPLNIFSCVTSAFTGKCDVSSLSTLQTEGQLSPSSITPTNKEIVTVSSNLSSRHTSPSSRVNSKNETSSAPTTAISPSLPSFPSLTSTFYTRHSDSSNGQVSDQTSRLLPGKNIKVEARNKNKFRDGRVCYTQTFQKHERRLADALANTQLLPPDSLSLWNERETLTSFDENVDHWSVDDDVVVVTEDSVTASSPHSLTTCIDNNPSSPIADSETIYLPSHCSTDHDISQKDKKKSTGFVSKYKSKVQKGATYLRRNCAEDFSLAFTVDGNSSERYASDNDSSTSFHGEQWVAWGNSPDPQLDRGNAEKTQVKTKKRKGYEYYDFFDSDKNNSSDDDDENDNEGFDHGFLLLKQTLSPGDICGIQSSVTKTVYEPTSTSQATPKCSFQSNEKEELDLKYASLYVQCGFGADDEDINNDSIIELHHDRYRRQSSYNLANKWVSHPTLLQPENSNAPMVVAEGNKAVSTKSPDSVDLSLDSGNKSRSKDKASTTSSPDDTLPVLTYPKGVVPLLISPQQYSLDLFLQSRCGKLTTATLLQQPLLPNYTESSDPQTFPPRELPEARMRIKDLIIEKLQRKMNKSKSQNFDQAGIEQHDLVYKTFG